MIFLTCLLNLDFFSFHFRFTTHFFLGNIIFIAYLVITNSFIFIIGVLNAYNFMDGINGITGLYSFVILSTLYYINQYKIIFTMLILLFIQFWRV